MAPGVEARLAKVSCSSSLPVTRQLRLLAWSTYSPSLGFIRGTVIGQSHPGIFTPRVGSVIGQLGGKNTVFMAQTVTERENKS